MADEKLIRTFLHKSPMTASKQAVIGSLCKEYRKGSTYLSSVQWKLFYTSGKFNKFLPTKDITFETPLTKRYLQNAQANVVSSLTSYMSNRHNDCINIIYRSSRFSKPQKKELAYAIKGKLWIPGIENTRDISQETISLAKYIFRKVISRNRKPNFKRTNLNLDSRFFTITDKLSDERHSATSFPLWVKLVTLDKRKPIYLPVARNAYYERTEGTRLNFLQVNSSEQKGIQLGLIKELDNQKATYKPETDSLALDFGLSVLFTTEYGDLLGRHFFDVISKYDAIISKIAANRQKAKLPVKCKKYISLVNKLRAYIKGEVNRCLNWCVAHYKPKQLILENLHFTSPSLSRRMNRLVQNCGRSIIKSKLASLEETYGIQVQEINPAYTSQQCSSCGFVDKRNRPTRDTFVCKLCGRNLFADVNAARVIKSRSSVPNLADKYIRRPVILKQLVKSSWTEYERSPLRSRATRLARTNPYYADFVARLENFHDLPW